MERDAVEMGLLPRTELDSFAIFLAERFGCSSVVRVNGKSNEVSLESLTHAIPVCDWPVDRAAQMRCLHQLRIWAQTSPAIIVAARGDVDAPSLRKRLTEGGLGVDFVGFHDEAAENQVTVAIVAGRDACPPTRSPARFRVVAIMPVFNEADIIEPALDWLIGQGLEVYILDNWSTDGSERIASRFLGRGLLKIERFPPEGPQPRYELRRTLLRIAELAQKIEADWIATNDVDEVRCSPWPGLTLRDAIYTVDRRGFNAIDYTNIIFEPTDDAFRDGGSLSHFRHFRFGPDPWHLLKINTWKRLRRPVNLVESGGHEVRFKDRRIFPYKFLLKHYPIRTQKQGERKIFRERKARWSEEERALGWHVQYDQILEGSRLIRDPATLLEFDPTRFPEEFLIERLSGIRTLHAWESGSRTIAVEGFSDITMDASSLKDVETTGSTESDLSAAAALGRAEAELTETKLSLRESQEREQGLVELVLSARERLATAQATEEELRIQMRRYAQFYEAVQRSRAWKIAQYLRRLFGREW